jgi:hypothetical protein
MPLDFRAEKFRLITGSMLSTISSMPTATPVGVLTEPSGSIVRTQDGRLWVNVNGGTTWHPFGPTKFDTTISGSLTGTAGGQIIWGANGVTKVGFLHEFTKSGDSRICISSYGANTTNAELTLFSARGTAAATTAPGISETLGALAFCSAPTATGIFSAAIIQSRTTEAWSSSNRGANLIFYNTHTGGTNRQVGMTLQDSNIGVRGDIAATGSLTGSRIVAMSTTNALISVYGDTDGSGNPGYTGYTVNKAVANTELWYIGRNGTDNDDGLIIRRASTTNDIHINSTSGDVAIKTQVSAKAAFFTGSNASLPCVTIKNTSTAGYSAVDYYDHTGTLQAGIGWANAAATPALMVRNRAYVSSLYGLLITDFTTTRFTFDHFDGFSSRPDIRTSGSLTGSNLLLSSTGPASIQINADTDNITETDTAQLRLTQDALVSTANFGLDDANRLIIGANSTTTPGIMFCTRGDGTSYASISDVKFAIYNNGNSQFAADLYITGSLTGSGDVALLRDVYVARNAGVTGTLRVAGWTYLGTGPVIEGVTVGRDTGVSVAEANGYMIYPFTDGNNYIDTKVFTGGTTIFRAGAGPAEAGSARTWMTLNNTSGDVSFGKSVTVAGSLTGSGGVTFAGTLSTSAEITPTQITSNQNDFNPTNLANATILHLTSDASRNVTGLVAQSSGRHLWLTNSGSFDITLKMQDVLSVAANRFWGNGGADVVLSPQMSAYVIYSATMLRWMVVNYL